jgi:hypothetical protein
MVMCCDGDMSTAVTNFEDILAKDPYAQAVIQSRVDLLAEIDGLPPTVRASSLDALKALDERMFSLMMFGYYLVEVPR